MRKLKLIATLVVVILNGASQSLWASDDRFGNAEEARQALVHFTPENAIPVSNRLGGLWLLAAARGDEREQMYALERGIEVLNQLRTGRLSEEYADELLSWLRNTLENAEVEESIATLGSSEMARRVIADGLPLRFAYIVIERINELDRLAVSENDQDAREQLGALRILLEEMLMNNRQLTEEQLYIVQSRFDDLETRFSLNNSSEGVPPAEAIDTYDNTEATD